MYGSSLALSGRNDATADIGDTNTLLPLLTDIILGIIRVNLEILETLITIGIITKGNDIFATAIGHLMQVETLVPYLRLDAAHQIVVGIGSEVALRYEFGILTHHDEPLLTIEGEVGDAVAIALLLRNPRSEVVPRVMPDDLTSDATTL